MPRHTTVAVDDNLATRKSGIALWPANDKPSRGIHQHILVLHIEARFADNRPDDVSQNPGAQFVVVDHVGVLGRNHDLIERNRLRVLVCHADLRFPIRPEPGELATLSHSREPLGQPVRDDDWQRHQRRRFVRRIAEHHALIPRPALVHAECDVGGLAIDGRQDRASLGIESEVRVGIADRRDGSAHDVGDMDVCRSGDFAGDDRHAGRDQRFAGYSRRRIFQQNRIQNRVGDLIRDLIGVPFRN